MTSLPEIFSTEYIADPYPTLHRLRSEHPVYWSEAWGCWLVLRYRDVLAGLRDPRLSSSKMNRFSSELPEQVRHNLQPLVQVLSSFMGLSDPPNHTRLRGLVNKAFTPRVVEGMRGRIQTLVNELLDAVDVERGMDAIRDFAYPLPATVISEMLGLPREGINRFKKWSDDIVGFIGAGRASIERAERGQQSMTELIEYYRPLIEHRRQNPSNDLISALTAAQEQGDHLDDIELLATSITLMTGGHETTTGLIGNSLLALARHPDQLQKLKDNPGLLGTAVEELLRYDSPVQRAERVTAQELNIGDQPIRKGERVFMMIGAANRDPAQFPEPDRLDVARLDNKHVAFGQGIHFCIGAPLARLEGAIALNSFVNRFPTFSLASDLLESKPLEWQENVAIRSLKALPLEFES